MYTALYREYRPDTFDQVVGQDMVVRTLKNQIKNKRIAHAYLFCGSRGTGKTSTAKVFSKAINCIEPKEHGPCLKCKVCESLSSGNSMDVIEIDAASNNGVDDVRDLREKVKYPPSVGAYKVYIIDEVHMLSAGAFNALLKTLEEPPAHAVFILATTEPHKLPSTILSRCQRFDFKRIRLQTLVEWLRSISGSIEVEVEEAALYTIARWSKGGARDALSLLDQSIGLCGDKISNDDILSILGTADQDFIFNTADDLISGNVEGLLKAVNHLLDDGKDLTVFLNDIINHFRNLLVAKLCYDPSELLDAETSELERLKAQSQTAKETRLVRAVEIFTALVADMKWSNQPRVLFELALVQVCRPSQEDSHDALIDRIEELEKHIKKEGHQAPRQFTETRAVYKTEAMIRDEAEDTVLAAAQDNIKEASPIADDIDKTMGESATDNVPDPRLESGPAGTEGLDPI
ncbi:MAG TPA: DNA polymerase III subunit gamma/tau, partial [Bacillota bacterium]|nr:DNA polymerase III subunit gamma/tau [Bacillota bacterium]